MTCQALKKCSCGTGVTGLVGHIQSAPGFLTLKSTDPHDYPAIFPNYLGADDDIIRIAEGVRQVRPTQPL